MNNKIQNISTIANKITYNGENADRYWEGAPHLRHNQIYNLYNDIVLDIYSFAESSSEQPNILDLGAGEGTATLSFLNLGAKVTAIDISQSQLDLLKKKCRHFDERLEIICDDVNTYLERQSRKFDIIVTNSFLHHIPDYLGLIKKIIRLLGPHGQFFLFQDPLKYDSISRLNYYFSNFAYFSWRIFRGKLLRGIRTRIRRVRNMYCDNLPEDNTEFHIVRNGVDQNAICNLLEVNGFKCDMIKYFSTQSHIFQCLGDLLGVKNTFAIIAKKEL